MFLFLFVTLRRINKKSGSIEAPFELNTWLDFWKWKQWKNMTVILTKTPQTGGITMMLWNIKKKNTFSQISITITQKICAIGFLFWKLELKYFSPKWDLQISDEHTWVTGAQHLFRSVFLVSIFKAQSKCGHLVGFCVSNYSCAPLKHSEFTLKQLFRSIFQRLTVQTSNCAYPVCADKSIGFLFYFPCVQRDRTSLDWLFK